VTHPPAHTAIGRRAFLATAGALAAGAVLAGCGGQAAPSGAPAAGAASGAGASRATGASLQAVVDAARKEGQLTLTWSETSVGGAPAVDRYVKGFNALHGLNINVQFTPGPSVPDMVAKIIQEAQAGHPASSDVIIGGPDQLLSMSAASALRQVDWTAWAPNIQNPKLVTLDGGAVEIFTNTPCLTYNSAKLTGAEVPKTLDDVLKPQYRGRVASTPYAQGFGDLASPELWGEQRTLDYVGKLSQQIAGLMRCGETARIVSGEFDMLALDCGTEEVTKTQAKGGPVDFVIPTDAGLLDMHYMGVPSNAAHPNAAGLFIDFIVSRAGQDIMFELAHNDHYLIPGSKTAPAIQKFQAAGAVFHVIDVAHYQRNDVQQMNKVRAKLQNLLTKKA